MILCITMMTAAALISPPDPAEFNLGWAQNAFSVQTEEMQPGRVKVLYEDASGDTKFASGTAGGPIALGGKQYAHGIGVNAHSVVHVTLPRPGKLFRADIGLDRNVDSSAGSVRFCVEVAGRALFSTEVMRAGDAARSVEIALDGAQTFDLIVDNGGDTRAFDQADWADARALLDDGREVFLDVLTHDGGGSASWPFSFVYGGRPSYLLLPYWDRRMEEEAGQGWQRRTLIFRDPATKLEVRLAATLYTDSPGADWLLHFTNNGEADTPVLEQIRALDATFGCGRGAAVTFHSLRSTGGADDWLPFSEPLAAGQRRAFAPNNGRSSSGACPFFDVQWPGGGAMAGIGWSGQWNAAVENRDGAVNLQAGMANLHLLLHPGESIRTPRILLLRWNGDKEEDAYNLWRHTMFQHIMPRVHGDVVVPPIAHLSTAFYEMDKCTEATALEHLNAGKDLGFECSWYDAYYGKDDFPSVGNYVLPLARGFNTARFPNLLQPLADAAHAAGMQFLLWFEPERICPGTLMATEHPEWVVLPGDGGWGMFNLAVPEARQYITDYLGGLIDAYGLNWVRIDNAVSYAPLWRKLDAAAGPDRAGMAEIRYVEGLYRWWDDMRAAHPGIAIDNCASGGGRIDLELCARSIPLWRTDATIAPLINRDLHQAALQNQAMTAGLSRYVPFNVSGQMGADPYDFRSGFNAGISFCEDTRPAEYPRELLRAAIAEGKRIRKYFFGDLYTLTEVTVDPRDWQVCQYHRAGEGDGLVIAFRRHQSPYTGFTCALRGIDDTAEYEVTVSSGYVPGSPKIMKGEELRGIVINISEMPGSALAEYRKLPR